MASGSAASDDAVEKAMSQGSLTQCQKRRSGHPRKERDRHERQQDEHDQRAVEREHQGAEVPEHAEAAVSHRDRHRRADADRRELHDDAGELEHHLRQPLAEPRASPPWRARLHLGERGGEEDGEEDDLEHFVPGRGVEEAVRDGMLQHARQRCPGGWRAAWPCVGGRGERRRRSPGRTRFTAPSPMNSATVVTTSK